MKKVFGIIFLILIFFMMAAAKCEIFPIDATNNAQNHNNRGIEYMNEKNYIPAIKEFKIALALNRDNQTSATYHYNMGCAYLHLARLQQTGIMINTKDNFANYAEISFQNAINQDCMQFNYYKNLVKSIEMQGNLGSALKSYQEKTYKNPFAQIVVALIYEKMGKKTNAKICLDEFVAKYPQLIITPAIERYMDKL